VRGNWKGKGGLVMVCLIHRGILSQHFILIRKSCTEKKVWGILQEGNE